MQTRIAPHQFAGQRVGQRVIGRYRHLIVQTDFTKQIDRPVAPGTEQVEIAGEWGTVAPAFDIARHRIERVLPQAGVDIQGLSFVINESQN